MLAARTQAHGQECRKEQELNPADTGAELQGSHQKPQGHLTSKVKQFFIHENTEVRTHATDHLRRCLRGANDAIGHRKWDTSGWRLGGGSGRTPNSMLRAVFCTREEFKVSNISLHESRSDAGVRQFSVNEHSSSVQHRLLTAQSF